MQEIIAINNYMLIRGNVSSKKMFMLDQGMDCLMSNTWLFHNSHPGGGKWVWSSGRYFSDLGHFHTNDIKTTSLIKISKVTNYCYVVSQHCRFPWQTDRQMKKHNAFFAKNFVLVGFRDTWDIVGCRWPVCSSWTLLYTE